MKKLTLLLFLILPLCGQQAVLFMGQPGAVPVSLTAGSGTVTSIATTSPITGGTITATGTIACATCVTSAASLTASAIVLGAGSQATSTLGSLGTTTTLLHGNAAGAPTFGAVVSADLNITTTTCSAQFVRSIAASAVGTCGAIVAADLPVVPLTAGTSVTLTNNSRYFVCTSTCTITVPVPAAGVQYCVRNGNNVSTVITLAAIGTGAMYENTASTAYGTAGTGTLISGGAVGDKICIVGLDSTHYLTLSYSGTWTAS